LLQQEANTVVYGNIVDSRNEIVDEVLLTVFRTPHSFTGEDVVEISCHGSVYIQQRILQLLIEQGCILAKPGEFTQRAFLNGKWTYRKPKPLRIDCLYFGSITSHGVEPDAGRFFQ